MMLANLPGLLADACQAFNDHCAHGIEPNNSVINEHLTNNLMLVTALTPHIGYDAAAAIAKTAHHQGLTLRAAALASGVITAEQYDTWVIPLAMTQPEREAS